ncbi:MAG: radical SAM protein [Deltaproteobacteria bacterium]|nr:radical SAM protein [Deltaproteobacteria bacterium]
MLKLLPIIPSYYLFRTTGWARRLPLNVTLSFSFKCNSRCLTCNVYDKTSDEMDLDEWRRIFYSLGKAPFWVTVSGGEPFLREDLPALVRCLFETCRPSIINIPTNGLLTNTILQCVDEIVRHCAAAKIVINLSIDELGSRHDEIRGVQGNFVKAMETYNALKGIKSNNLTVGFHTVISRFNVNRIPEIYRYLIALDPDSYVTEIAEEREELGTVSSDIAPSYQAYVKAVDFIDRNLKKAALDGIGKMARAFRSEYYQMVKRILKNKRQIIPCYAGFASAHIAPDGHVWACCTRAESMGNVKRNGYNLKRVWFSKKADQLRERIKKGQCWCPLANASYTNMLFHVKTLFRVGRNCF